MVVTDDEIATIVSLIDKLSWPLPPPIFHALVKKVVTVPIELMVRDKTGKILLIYRDDHEFKGWHMPGTVLRNNETVDEAVARLVKGEVGTVTTLPRTVGWFECPQTPEMPQRHAVALLHYCETKADYTGPGKFFSFTQLPPDTLQHHLKMIPEILRRH